MRGATDRATLDAQHNAELCATGLRTLISDPGFVATYAPDTATFEIADGRLVLPISWPSLEPVASRSLSELDLIVQEKLEAAATLEFHDRDARPIYEALLANPSTLKRDRSWLCAHIAWYCHRRGETKWRDELLAQLDEERGGSAAPSAALLIATVRHKLPTWASAAICQLPITAARPLLDRLREHTIDTVDLVTEFKRTQARRAQLRRIRPIIPALLAISDAGPRLIQGDLVFYQPRDEKSGSGALFEASSLASALLLARRSPHPGLPLVPWSGQLIFAVDTPSPVIPGFLGVEPRRAPTPLWSRGWSLGLVMLLLAGILATGLTLTWRSLRQRAETTRVRAEFLTMVTHELKTPLAGIRLLSELLEDGHVSAPDKRDEYYARLSSEAVRLSMLIENVLDLGRMERGERVYEFEPTDLKAVVREAIALFKPIAERDGITMRTELENLPLTLADRPALLQAFLNVFDNARKYGTDADHSILEVTGHRSADHYTVLIKDHGPGIPQGEQQAIFDRFERAQHHRDGNIPGVGLGLHLARTILRHHQGELDLAPSDHGAAFRFKLPIRSAP